ncbi:MAG: glycosyltransferase, partial [Bacteroidota bacterium]
RKGIAEVFAALDRLSEDNARRFALLLAGPVAESLRGNMSGWIARARARGVAVALHDAFVQEEEIQALLEASDALLLCYQRHIGSSAVLIRAAGAGLPVVGQAYGLMGDHIARHRLGCPVDSDDPASIAAALAVLARDPALTDHFDKRLARQFAEANTVEAYTTTLLRAFAPSTLPH